MSSLGYLGPALEILVIVDTARQAVASIDDLVIASIDLNTEVLVGEGTAILVVVDMESRVTESGRDLALASMELNIAVREDAGRAAPVPVRDIDEYTCWRCISGYQSND